MSMYNYDNWCVHETKEGYCRLSNERCTKAKRKFLCHDYIFDGFKK